MPEPSEPAPEYKKYRAGPRFLRRRPRDGESLLGGLPSPPSPPEPTSGAHGAPVAPGAATPPVPPGSPAPADPAATPRPWRLRRPRVGGPGSGRRPAVPGGRLARLVALLTLGRLLRWLLTAAVAWILLSLVLFLISAQLRQGELSGQVALGGAGYPLTSANTILVLGSDTRVKGSKEPGAATSGRGRSDSIMLMRVGGGKNARLSIPRDTVVDIPGHGRDKINAAYAYGGPALAVQTIEQYLGLQVNHLIEVNFENFPELIDAMGGVTYEGGCVVSRINGGFKNGGYTLRLKRGKTHIDGRQALALARTRKNDCKPSESDLTRARRQQKLLAAMKSRLVSPGAFLRLPNIAWNTPKALRSDMSGPTLLGLFGALATGGTAPIRLLKADGAEQAPGGGAGLHVSDAEKARDVRRFLAG